jgi:hypothetical protein
MLNGEVPAPADEIRTDTVTFCGVEPDPLAESQGVAEEMEEVKVNPALVPPIDRVCDAFRLVEVCTNDRDAGDLVNSGAALTTSVTGMSNGLFAAPGDAMATASVYMPAGSPAAFTLIWRIAGVVPAPLITIHGEPPATDAENGSGVPVLPKAIATGKGGALLEPNENTALPGLAVRDGALEIVSVMGIIAGLFPAPVDVNTIENWYTPADKPTGEIASVKVAGVVLESCVTVM